MIQGSGSGKINALFNLIGHQPDTDKIHLYTKGPFEAKYQLLISKCKDPGLEHCTGSKVFIECSYIYLQKY